MPKFLLFDPTNQVEAFTLHMLAKGSSSHGWVYLAVIIFCVYLMGLIVGFALGRNLGGLDGR